MVFVLIANFPIRLKAEWVFQYGDFLTGDNVKIKSLQGASVKKVGLPQQNLQFLRNDSILYYNLFQGSFTNTVGTNLRKIHKILLI